MERRFIEAQGAKIIKLIELEPIGHWMSAKMLLQGPDEEPRSFGARGYHEEAYQKLKKCMIPIQELKIVERLLLPLRFGR